MNKGKIFAQAMILLFATLALAPATSCSARRVAGSSDPSQAAPSASHALQDIRIREIMGRLALPIDRMPQEVDPVAHRQALLDEMAVVAQELEENSDRIPEVLQNVEMTDAHRMEFLESARQLAGQAVELRTHAKEGDLAGAQRVMEEIDSTCQNCHERFRVLPLRRPPTGSDFDTNKLSLIQSAT